MNRIAEGHGNSVDEAIQQALRQLGLTADQVFVEILSEGSRRGLFGGRRAHVRAIAKDAIVAPEATSGTTSKATSETTSGTTSSEPQLTEEDGVTANETEDVAAEAVDTRDENATEIDGDGQARESLREQMTPEEWLDLLDQEAEMAADFVEGLLDRLDLPGDLEIEVTEDQALVNVQDLGSGLLIGRRGATLDALQELVRSAVQRQTQRRAHVRVDVEGYRARQLEKLRDKCREAIAEVRETGNPVRLEPMDAFERKMMHDLVAKTGGVTSTSEGSEPKRRVVIEPE